MAWCAQKELQLRKNPDLRAACSFADDVKRRSADRPRRQSGRRWRGESVGIVRLAHDAEAVGGPPFYPVAVVILCLASGAVVIGHLVDAQLAGLGEGVV